MAIAFAAVAATCLARGAGDGPVVVRVVPSRQQVVAGGDLAVAVILDHRERWHTHTNAPVVPPELDYFIPIATKIAVEVPQDSPLEVHPAHIQWPPAEEVMVRFFGEPVPYGVFGHRSIAYVPLTVAARAKPGPATLAVKISFQACDENSCRPEAKREISLRLEVVEAASDTVRPAEVQQFFDGFDAGVWQQIRGGQAAPQNIDFSFFGWSFAVDGGAGLATLWLLLLAAAGGLLLNFTPCVLPVIPIKVLSLRQAAGNRSRCAVLGTSMSVGIIGFWVALGCAMAALSELTATSQLFQFPLFTVVVGLVVIWLAFGMCGFFSFPLPGWVQGFDLRRETLVGSFGLGIMTAVLSTPCTGPFMASAAAWAVTQTPPTTIMIFAAIGVGMALPYQVLSLMPGLVEKLPRTGPGSELLKQVMGMLLAAAGVYFVGAGISGWTAGPGGPPGVAYWWPVMLVVAFAGLWLAWGTLKLTRRLTPRAVFVSLGVVVAAASCMLAVRFTDRGPIEWRYYDPRMLDAALAEGNVVVLDFTAEWCLNCKALEHGVLHRADVVRALHEPGVVPMKVDLTGANPRGWARLKQEGRVNIPLLVVLRADGSRTLTAETYTAEPVVEAIRAAAALPEALEESGAPPA